MARKACLLCMGISYHTNLHSETKPHVKIYPSPKLQQQQTIHALIGSTLHAIHTGKKPEIYQTLLKTAAFTV